VLAGVAASAAAEARELLKEHGATTLEFYSLRCPGRQHVKTWMKLERGLLLVFRQRFGVIPIANKQGKRMKWTDELTFFTRSRLSPLLRSTRDRPLAPKLLPNESQRGPSCLPEKR